jgi:hypothetical protein
MELGSPKKSVLSIRGAIRESNHCTQSWEETLKAMVKHHPNFHDTVDEMWLLDAANQGDSAIINEGYLGDVCKSCPLS